MRVSCSIGIMLFTLLVSGHADLRGGEPSPESPETLMFREIRPEEARQALIEMLEQSPGSDFKKMLCDVRKAEIKPHQIDGCLQIDRWIFHPRSRTIHCMCGLPNSFVYFDGVLEFSKYGKWQARITSSGSICALAPPLPGR